jgi:DNA-binding response OmpR family regulator
VLAALDARAGSVVRREQLVREVWGGEGNALASIVSGVRRKLGAQSSALETVRGVGYRLRPLAGSWPKR